VIRKIWIYWHQGFDNLPVGIVPCVEQWKALHNNWEVHLIDNNTIFNHIKPLKLTEQGLNNVGLAHYSDLIRNELLIQHGGVWADPSTYPLKSLDEWLPEYLKKTNYFFFYKPGRTRLISNWFIAAKPQSKMLKLLNKNLIKYWNTNRFRNKGKAKNNSSKFYNKILNRNLYLPLLWLTPFFTKLLKLSPYMIYHYMFLWLLLRHKNLNNEFKTMPKVYAEKSHIIDKYNMFESLDNEIELLITKKEVHIIKLEWKAIKKEPEINTNLGFLFNQLNKNHAI
jgi:hypothetical protein